MSGAQDRGTIPCTRVEFTPRSSTRRCFLVINAHHVKEVRKGSGIGQQSCYADDMYHGYGQGVVVDIDM